MQSLLWHTKHKNKMDDKYFLAAIQATKGIGGSAMKKLLAAFGTGEAIWEANTKDIIAQTNISASAALELDIFRNENKDAPQKIRDDCERVGVTLCSLLDDNYPAYLKEIYNPPLILYVRGTLTPNERGIAIVGSRDPSPYGANVAERFAEELATKGVTVVSGAARGIDAAAHRGALRAGRTIAVLGCGVDIAYPAANRDLLREITTKGAVVSEYPLGSRPLAGNFPARNRIISGLAQGTLVVEAGEKSGALITAKFALDENRDVFAVPGSIFSPQSVGCHRLIQQGAKLVADVGDILEEYGETPKEEPPKVEMTDEEAAVYEFLSYEEPTSIDEIIMRTGNDNLPQVSALLLDMTLKGLIAETTPQSYVRAVGVNINK